MGRHTRAATLVNTQQAPVVRRTTMNNFGGVDFSFMAMAAAAKNRRDIERLEEDFLAEQDRQRHEQAHHAQTPIVIMYRRTDGSEASVSCAPIDYARQVARIEQRGYTILNVVK